LLQLYTGQKPNRQMMALIQFYLQGMATLEELWAGVDRQRQALARRMVWIVPLSQSPRS
jgi:hypothetical protein